MSDVVKYIDMRITECAKLGHDHMALTLKDVQTIRAELAEARRQLKEASEQEPVAMVVHHNPPFGAVYKVEWYTKYRDLPDGTKLYAAPVPQPAVPVDDICNAYESGVGHNGRPTANVNPYPPGTPQHTAYELGAKGTKHNAPAVPETVALLSELYAQVQGECPALLDESRGGDGALRIRIATILSATDSEVKK